MHSPCPRFQYLRDPVFVLCLLLYFVNRWVWKPLLPGEFFHNYLNDVICIPFWVPIMLWLMRKIGIRTDDDPPQWHEILIPLLMWSFLFEVWLPRVSPFRLLAFADSMDVLCYAMGAFLALQFWRRWYGERQVQNTSQTI
jgi:hypothetical protein